jgi:hypothetical protein
VSPSPEDVIRVHDLRRNDADSVRELGDRMLVRNERLTTIGAVNVKIDGTSKRRAIPTPWIDCEDCGRRHYPSTIGGRWHIATTCLSCGIALPGR